LARRDVEKAVGDASRGKKPAEIAAIFAGAVTKEDEFGFDAWERLVLQVFTT
jgi:hypothetical protein